MVSAYPKEISIRKSAHRESMFVPALIMEECAIEHLDVPALRSVTSDLVPGASAGSNGSADRMTNRGPHLGVHWNSASTLSTPPSLTATATARNWSARS